MVTSVAGGMFATAIEPQQLPIPGTGSVSHLRENLAADDITLDDQALRDLDRVSP
jgi:pyridoxine 4-dehydrogenase